MWTTRLMLLGLVRWLQPVHGYELLRELTSWGVEEWAKVKPGSIYHGLKKLTTDGCLEVVATEQVDNRPARTSYKITAKGEAEFQETLRAKLWELAPVQDPFFIAWSFVPVLGRREAAAMLRNRAAMLRDVIAKQEVLLDLSSPEDFTRESFLPMHVKRALELGLEAMKLSVRWCEETAVEAENGTLGIDDIHSMPPEAVEHWKAHIATLPDPGRA
ncbi:MAG: PadR family transcriptional regulator [Saccharothrix sp.]|nr:PadR family transcriptional regulator [Saccharothrix sp.]